MSNLTFELCEIFTKILTSYFISNFNHSCHKCNRKIKAMRIILNHFLIGKTAKKFKCPNHVTRFTTTRSNNTCYKLTFYTARKVPCRVSFNKSFWENNNYSLFFYCSYYLEYITTFFYIISLKRGSKQKLTAARAGFSHTHGQFVYVNIRRKMSYKSPDF